MSGEEADRLLEFYQSVPTRTKVIHVWDTPGGRAFLGFVNELARQDVPLRWIAKRVGMEEGALQQATMRTTFTGGE